MTGSFLVSGCTSTRTAYCVRVLFVWSIFAKDSYYEYESICYSSRTANTVGAIGYRVRSVRLAASTAVVVGCKSTDGGTVGQAKASSNSNGSRGLWRQRDYRIRGSWAVMCWCSYYRYRWRHLSAVRPPSAVFRPPSSVVRPPFSLLSGPPPCMVFRLLFQPRRGM